MTQRLRWKLGENEIEVEGTDEFIEAQLNRFLERLQTPVRPTRPENVPDRIVAAITSGKSLSPAEYIRQKNPKTGTEILVVLGKYLEDFRSASEFKTSDIRKLALEAKIKDVHSQYFTYAVKQGLLRPTGKGYYSLTISGEDVVQAMPAGTIEPSVQ